MAQDQYVLQFKFLRFAGDWGAPQLLPQGVMYTAGEKSLLIITVLLEPNQFEMLTFAVPVGKMVGVSLTENLVFLPTVGIPTKAAGWDIFR